MQAVNQDTIARSAEYAEGDGSPAAQGTLHILFVEDNPYDVELMLCELRSRGLDVMGKVVSSAIEFARELGGPYDLVICDHDLPSFDAPSALAIYRQIRSDIPFIVVSGGISEELAVTCMKQGAADYLLKDRLTRLPMAIDQARSRCRLARLAQDHAEQLRIREEQYRSLVHGISDYAVIRLAVDGRITTANPAIESIYGFTVAELLGQPVAVLLDNPQEGGCEELLSFFQQQGGRPSLRRELRQRRKDGSYFIADISLSTILGGGSALVGFTLIARDITQRLLAERERAEMLELERQARIRSELLYEEAQSSNQLKDEFLATLSHELRTPLGVIVGWSDLLQRGEVAAADCAETIYRNAQNQLRLIDEVLDMSRIVSKTLTLNQGLVDAERTIREVVNSFAVAIKAKNLSLDLSISEGLHAVVTDGQRLQQIVWNLLSNAIKFSFERGRVQVRASRERGRLLLSVSDEGHGVDPAFLPHIFERFRQEDGSITRQYGGLGLGLAIVKHLVELQGGTVEASSQGRNAGACFTLRLPMPIMTSDGIADTWRQGASAASSGACRPLESRKRLEELDALFIDDDPFSLEMEQALAMSHLSSVRGFASAQDALTYLQDHHVDIIFCDIGMAGMDGFTFIKNLRRMEAERSQRTAAIALTAYTASEDREKALDVGFDAFLPKPTTRRDLLDTARTVLREKGLI